MKGESPDMVLKIEALLLAIVIGQNVFALSIRMVPSTIFILVIKDTGSDRSSTGTPSST